MSVALTGNLFNEEQIWKVKRPSVCSTKNKKAAPKGGSVLVIACLRLLLRLPAQLAWWRSGLLMALC